MVSCVCLSYLARAGELEWPQARLHVGNVGLEVVESIGDALLDLRGAGPRGGVGGDLVEGWSRHVGGGRGLSNGRKMERSQVS